MDRREQDVAEAKAARARLERQSSGDGRRLDIAAVLNALTKIDATRQAPGFEALNSIRQRQRLARRSSSAHNRAHDEFTKAVAGATSENFNRLFPRDKLAAATVAASIVRNDDARSQRYTPDLEARRLLDAAGRLASSSRRDQDHWPTGEPEAIAAQFLLSEARRLIAELRAQEERAAAENMAAGRIVGAGRG